MLAFSLRKKKKKDCSSSISWYPEGKSTFLELNREWKEAAWMLVKHQQSILHWKIPISTRTRISYDKSLITDPPTNHAENV